MNDIPVALVVYNRARHTFEVLKALRAHNVQSLYIFCDGPKRPEDAAGVRQVRDLVKRIDWCRPQVVERDENIGLARSIVSAADTVFRRHDSLILLEDDCVPQKYFFDFVGTCLTKYKDNPRVFGVTGYTVGVPDAVLRNYPYDLYFCPRIGSWGWATWKDRWARCGRNLHRLIDTTLRNGVDLDQGGSDIPVALDNILKGDVKDVWTLHWLLSVYINNGVYVYPTRSHVANIGMDGTGVHCRKTNKYDSPLCRNRPARYPEEVSLDGAMMANFRRYYDAPPARRAAVRLPSQGLAPKPTLQKAVNRPARQMPTQSEMRRICYLNAGDIKGGAYRVGWWLKEGLKDRGYSTKLLVRSKLSTDSDVTVVTDAIADGGNFYRNRGFLFYDINSTFKISARPEFAEADIVHYHNLHGNFFNPFALSRLTALKPAVWTLHDMQALTGRCAYAFDCDKWQAGCGDCPHPESYPRGPVDKDQTAAMWRDKKRIYADCDIELIVPSQWLGRQVQKSILADKPLHLIYNGIDEQVYRPYDKRTARRKYGIPAGATVLAFSANGGLIDKRKGGDYILQAYRHLIAKYKDVYFVCIGGRSNKAPTERFIQTPFVLDENELARLYSAADIFLFPTLADNCPLAVLELMGCGVPVVSFETGGVPELIENGRSGLVAPYKDGDEFVRLADMLVSDVDKRKQLGRAGRKHLEAKFTRKKMLDEHEQLYRQVIERQKKKTHTRRRSQASVGQKVSGAEEYKYLVSAIVSAYNSERHIRGCLADLENQSIADRLEIIVVNSGSQQNEEAVVREFQRKYDNITYIRTESRETIYAAWNRAIRAASGKYITSANTDDRHRPEAFEKMSRALEERPDVVLVYADQHLVEESGGRRTIVREHVKGEFSRTRLFAGECPPGSQPMWRSDVHDAMGFFDEAFFISGDYEFWFRLTQNYDFIYLNEFLGERFIGPTAVSRAHNKLLSLENAVINKCYEYALQTGEAVASGGISGDGRFSDWPEVNLWRQRVGAKLNGKQRKSQEFIKEKSDLRKTVGVERPRLSVVIVTYNRPEELGECLNSLAEQTESQFEVIVVSNAGSLESLRQKASRFAHGLCAIELTDNLGPSFARNVGASCGRADYIAFVDDDAIADKDFVKNTIARFSRGDICGLRGRVLPKTASSEQDVPEYYDLGEKEIATTCEASSHCAFKKDIFFKAGGFDVELFGLEGIELSYRIFALTGAKLNSIVYCPEVMVRHDSVRSSERLIAKQLRNDTTRSLLANKHAGIQPYISYCRSLYPANYQKVRPDYEWLLSNAIFLQERDAAAAVEWAAEAVALDPEILKGRFLLGSLHLALGRYERAAEELEASHEMLQGMLQCHSARYRRVGGPDQSHAECYVSVCTKLAQCYMKLGRADRLKWVYGELLGNKNLNLSAEQRQNMQSVLARLKSVRPAPPQTQTQAQMQKPAPGQPGAQDRQDKYLVSAIVSTYNAARFIRGCLADLENQTIADKVEIIVVNSGSQQNEEAVVREFQKRYDNIVYIRTEQREGIYSAWNRAVKVARGKFLTNANADDRHRQDALEVMANSLLAEPEIALVYADSYITETPNGTFDNPCPIRTSRQPEYSRGALLAGSCIGSHPMWRKELHDEFGLFDESLSRAGDWDFWIRVSDRYNFKHIPQVLSLVYRDESEIPYVQRVHSPYERYVVGKRYGTEYLADRPCYPGRDGPMVSVVLAAEDLDCIREVVESVLIQTYRNFELIIVDNSATEQVRGIISAFDDEKLRVIHTDGRATTAAALNRAIREAKGTCIVRVNSEDILLPEFLYNCLKVFEQNPQLDMVYCDGGYIEKDGIRARTINPTHRPGPANLLRDMFRFGSPATGLRTCIKRGALEKTGLYDERLDAGEDYDLLWRCGRAGLKAAHINGPMYLRQIFSTRTEEDAAGQFRVLSRIVDSAGHNELFPDVDWTRFSGPAISLHAGCLIAATLLATAKNCRLIGAAGAAEQAAVRARRVLSQCLAVEPRHERARQLLSECEQLTANAPGRAGLSQAAAGDKFK